MTDLPAEEGAEREAVKEPPPILTARAPRPQAIRLRRGAVQAAVLVGAVLVSGSLAWAFVIQPELRDGRVRQARDVEAPDGEVRPADVLFDQPATYDRLPPPRIGEADEKPVDQPAPIGRASAGPTAARPMRRREPSARDMARASALFWPASVDGIERTPDVMVRPEPPERTPPALARPLSPFELQAGTLITAALLTAVETGREGPVIASVTQNVFDTVTGRHLLVPQGSRLIGRAGGDGVYGDRRAFVTWDRLILPNGRSLALAGEPGVDAQGAVGVRGQADRRLAPLLTAAVFGGAITTLGQIARDDDRERSGGWLGDAGDAAAIEGSRIGGRLVERELEVRPSIRLRPGALVNVLITHDLTLEPYQR